jgi:hypothetical protein
MRFMRFGTFAGFDQVVSVVGIYKGGTVAFFAASV